MDASRFWTLGMSRENRRSMKLLPVRRKSRRSRGLWTSDGQFPAIIAEDMAHRYRSGFRGALFHVECDPRRRLHTAEKRPRSSLAALTKFKFQPA